MSTDLKPCPFCGQNVAELKQQESGQRWWAVRCSFCHGGTDYWGDQIDAVHAWNCRGQNPYPFVYSRDRRASNQ